jgi:lysyl-tRNA synthetase class 1
MDPVIPPAIEAVIVKFDQTNAPIDEHEVKKALTTARQALNNPAEAENLGAWAEALAFALVPSRHSPSPWKTYFGPFGSGTREDGATVYFPDIVGTDAEVVAHWMQRAKSLKHPVLKARYADLAWDMSRAVAKTNPDLDMARIAIDAYLASLAGKLRREMHDQFEAAIRALDLAVMIRDARRTEAARAALLNLHREAVAAGEGLWWMAFDRLIDDKRAGLTDAQRDQLLADLEGVVAHRSGTSDPAVFDPHATESAAQRLIKHYRKNGRNDDARRLSEVIARVFEHFASLGDAMLASAVLQTAVNAYRDAGMREDSQRVRVAMEEKIGQSRDEMKPIVIERTISTDDMEKFLAGVVVGNLATTFARIASEFLQSRRDLEQRVRNSMEQAPLMATITHSIMADNHVAAQVGSVADDPFGRLIQQAAQSMSLADIWLIKALDKAIEVHGITPRHVASWAARTKLFDDLSLLVEGLMAWYDQDFVKAVHVLVPQAEVGLRGIVSKLGRPITKPHPTVPGVSVAIGMGDILYSKEIAEALGPDLTLHFLTLYADPRGFNLRNDLAHGLLRADRIHFPLACRVIHTLLVLGIWDELAEARRAAAQA